MDLTELTNLKDKVSDLVDQFNIGLEAKGLGHLKVDAIHFSRRGIDDPQFCYIDDQGRKICYPPA